MEAEGGRAVGEAVAGVRPASELCGPEEEQEGSPTGRGHEKNEGGKKRSLASPVLVVNGTALGLQDGTPRQHALPWDGARKDLLARDLEDGPCHARNRQRGTTEHVHMTSKQAGGQRENKKGNTTSDLIQQQAAAPKAHLPDVGPEDGPGTHAAPAKKGETQSSRLSAFKLAH